MHFYCIMFICSFISIYLQVVLSELLTTCSATKVTMALKEWCLRPGLRVLRSQRSNSHIHDCSSGAWQPACTYSGYRIPQSPFHYLQYSLPTSQKQNQWRSQQGMLEIVLVSCSFPVLFLPRSPAI